MKYIAEVENVLLDNKNNAHITLKIPNYRQAQELSSLEFDGKVFSVEMKVRKSQRSILSNRYMWALLAELERVTKEPAFDWYVKALIQTGAVVDYVWGTVDTEETLKKSFRAVVKVKPYKIKDSDGWLYRVIVGSSKFNNQEMCDLIDTVIMYCNEHYIDISTFNYE